MHTNLIPYDRETSINIQREAMKNNVSILIKPNAHIHQRIRLDKYKVYNMEMTGGYKIQHQKEEIRGYNIRMTKWKSYRSQKSL